MMASLSIYVDPDLALVFQGMIDAIAKSYRAGRLTWADYRSLREDIATGNLHHWMHTRTYWVGNACHLYVEPTEAFARKVWGPSPIPSPLKPSS